jgi:Holliday junction resolvasome RuvABC endonuclease subunit
MSSVIMQYDMDISIIDYPPSIIKKAVGANPLGNKSPVFNALSKNKEISNIVNLDLLTEHCVDSIAIAYTMLIEIRKEGILCLI